MQKFCLTKLLKVASFSNNLVPITNYRADLN